MSCLPEFEVVCDVLHDRMAYHIKCLHKGNVDVLLVKRVFHVHSRVMNVDLWADPELNKAAVEEAMRSMERTLRHNLHVLANDGMLRYDDYDHKWELRLTPEQEAAYLLGYDVLFGRNHASQVLDQTEQCDESDNREAGGHFLSRVR